MISSHDSQGISQTSKVTIDNSFFKSRLMDHVMLVVMKI